MGNTKNQRINGKISLNMDESAINRQWMVVDVIYKPSMIIRASGRSAGRGWSTIKIWYPKTTMKYHHQIDQPGLINPGFRLPPKKPNSFSSFGDLSQWIALGEHFAGKPPFFNGKNHGFLYFVPLNQSDMIHIDSFLAAWNGARCLLSN